MQPIYLDNNATTRIDPRVVSRMNDLWQQSMSNPASQHAAGRFSRGILEQAREALLELCDARNVGMSSDRFLFTSGGTESNNLAIFGLAEAQNCSVIVSAIEHPSVMEAANHWQSRGHRVFFAKVDPTGVLDLEHFEHSLRDAAALHSNILVSMMHANNETGVIQPIQQATEIAHRWGAIVHSDAVQSFGKIPLSFTELGIDAMTITAHKLHGPIGIGGLVLRSELKIQPQLFGGFQQLGLRPGTENPVLAAGFSTAAAIAHHGRASSASTIEQFRIRFENQLIAADVDAVIHGQIANRLPHTISVAFPGCDRQALLMALDLAGIACSTGSACASGSGQPSHVLQAMGMSRSLIDSSIRFSLSRQTTIDEIDMATERIIPIVQRLRTSQRRTTFVSNH